VPCLNLPGYRTAAGLPVGVTLTGPRFSDRRVLAAALAV
jgi:Asp-tRNA(Asn)/Glu-tRNA(Gln) amidotransferase A subunit family amidase